MYNVSTCKDNDDVIVKENLNKTQSFDNNYLACLLFPTHAITSLLRLPTGYYKSLLLRGKTIDKCWVLTLCEKTTL